MNIGMRVIGMLCGAVNLLVASTHAAPAPQAAERKIRGFVSSGGACGDDYRARVCGGQHDGQARAALAGGKLGDSGPFFGADVNALAAGQNAVIDASTPGSPVRSLRDIPAGDYYVQALVNIYTEFHRADGHTDLAAHGSVGRTTFQSFAGKFV